MKIRIQTEDKNEIIVDSRVIETNSTPSGNSYYRIEYLIDGEVVYACSSGCTSGTPSALEALDWEREIREPVPEGTAGAQKWTNSVTGSSWAINIVKTNRQFLVNALDRIVID